MLQLIIAAIAPQLFDSVVKRASCFRTIIVKLPPNIERDDLIQYLGNNLETDPTPLN